MLISDFEKGIIFRVGELYLYFRNGIKLKVVSVLVFVMRKNR